MATDIDFTGSETPSDVARAAIEWFSRKPNSLGITIFYENSIPKMKYEFQGGDVEYVCIYRLDKMLESFYSDAEQIFDENARAGFINIAERAILLPYIAFSGMTTMLSRLVGLQAEIFLQTFDETRMITAGAVLHSLVVRSERKSSLSRPASKQVQKWIDQLVAASLKKKRDFLVGFMNIQPLLRIPTGAGRPLGTTKPPDQLARESEAFKTELKEAIQSLVKIPGFAPLKTDVAKKLRIGGLNLKSGNDTSLSALRSKLKRLDIDYDEILAEMGLNKKSHRN